MKAARIIHDRAKEIIVRFNCRYLNLASAQDSVDNQIDRISWQSLVIIPTYATRLDLNQDAQKLVTSRNPLTIRKLVAAMTNDNKTVAIHMILSRMLEPKNADGTVEHVYKGKK